MCELFAMSSRLPATVTLSLKRLSRHGEADRHYGDGWGVAFYDGDDARIMRETTAVYDSALVKFIEDQQLITDLVISHLRRASTGAKTLANTHPFVRPLGGRAHVFAHNGNLRGIFDDPRFPIGRHRPLGDSDSELGFCALLARLETLWAGDAPPSATERFECVAQFAADIQSLGPANFLYGDSDALFAFGDRREQPGGRFAPPGLHILARRCREASDVTPMEGVAIAGVDQTVLLVASVPLSDEDWRPLEEGELVMTRRGEIVERGCVGA